MKRNLLKIPLAILDRIRSFDQDDVVAATVKLLRPQDVPDYGHLGLAIADGALTAPEPGPPPPSSGKYSTANLYGMEKVRRDLPKEPKEFGFWAPSWGSGSYHWVSHTRDVYRRDFYPPKEVNLSIEVLETRGNDFVVKFAIDQVISRRTPHFERELLYNLNLLQENVGAVGVFPSATTLQEYAATVHVDWQILPPGSVDEIVASMLKGKRPITAQQRTVMEERIAVMAKLKPEAFIAGSDGFLRYFGAKFGDDFVVFENARYGNALYLMYDDWQALSQKSRVELLAGDRGRFDRIIHQPGWVQQLTETVNDYRRRKRKQGKLL